MNPLLERIPIDPNVCFGKPCIRGTRIWVSLILDLLSSGMTIEDVIAEYPYLEGSDIRAAIAYEYECINPIDEGGKPYADSQPYRKPLES